MRKLFTFATLTAVTMSAVAAGDVAVVKTEAGKRIEAISADGKWASGGAGSQPLLWNVETGETFVKEGFDGDLVSVANTGLGGGVSGDYAVTMGPDCNMVYLDDQKVLGTVGGMSADGTIAVGAQFTESYYMTPGYWKDGKFTVLPVPADAEITDEEGFESQGTRAVSISANGSVIMGNIRTSMGVDLCIYWTRNASGEYEFHPLFEPYAELGFGEKPYVTFTGERMSQNGKWIALTLQLNDFDDWTYYMGRYNLETGKLEVAPKPEGMSGDVWASGIANNGLTVGFIGQNEASLVGRQGLLWSVNGEAPALISSFCDNDVDILSLEKEDANVPCDIDAEGKHVAGYILNADGAFQGYCITLPAILNGVENITADTQGVSAIYDLQGRRVNDCSAAGIYIMVQNGNARKVMVK